MRHGIRCWRTWNQQRRTEVAARGLIRNQSGHRSGTRAQDNCSRLRGSMRYALMTMLVMLCAFNAGLAEASTEYERETLRGLPGVQVIIDHINPDGQNGTLSKDTIRAAVELILQSSRIPILTRQERLKTSSAPFLYININTVQADNMPLFASNIHVELIQSVLLRNQAETLTFATTWHSSLAALAGSTLLKASTIENLESLVNEFVDDFIAMNPR